MPKKFIKQNRITRVASRPNEVRANEETEWQSLSHSKTLRLSYTTLDFLSSESDTATVEQNNLPLLFLLVMAKDFVLKIGMEMESPNAAHKGIRRNGWGWMG